MLKRTITLVSCALLATASLMAQMPRLYLSRAGLANTQIHDLYQDSQGFIWVSTENGLSRFDGMNFTNFRTDSENPASLESNHIKTTLEDSGGRLWVATSVGLQIFVSEFNSFEHVALPIADNLDADRHVTDLVEYKYKGRTVILASTSGYGVIVLDAETREPVHELTDLIDEALCSQFISYMYLDLSGNLWLAAENGGLTVFDLKRRKDRTGSIRSTPGVNISSVIVNAVMECDEVMLLGTLNQGLLIYDKSSGEMRRPTDGKARECNAMSFLRNNMLSPGSDKTVIAGLENDGIWLFDLETEKMSRAALPNVRYHTDNWKIHSLLEDNQGNIWIGAFQVGVMVLPKPMYGFENIKPGEAVYEREISSCVTSISKNEKNGELWLGTDGNGLYRIAGDGSIEHFHSGNSVLTNNSVMSLVFDKRGTLWIATYLGGLFSYTPGRGLAPSSVPGAENLQKTVALHYSEAEDILYVGTHGQGFVILDLKTMNAISTPASNHNKWISTMFLDRNGLLWVGTYKGFFCYSHKLGKYIDYNLESELPSHHITAFEESADGKIWIGTNLGLLSYEIQSGKVVSYSKQDGLSDSSIMAIRFGNDGNLWISTQHGLSRLNPANGEIRSYYQNDGLQENEFLANAAFRDLDGKLYFGGIKGVSAFYPYTVCHNPHPVPPLHFSNLSVMNRRREYDARLRDRNVLDKNLTQASSLTLPYKENIFSIEFSVLEYSNPNKIVYAYKLEGFDNDWNYAGPENRSATYTNVPVGKYKLAVKAYFDGFPETSSGRELYVRILPPWYGSWWAILLYLCLASGAAYLVVDWRRHQLSIKKEMMESEAKESRLRLFTNLSHEIRTPLSLILGPLKDLKETEQDEKLRKLYSLMYRNGLRVFRLANQMLDIRKIDNGQMHLHFQETDMVYFVRDIMQSFENLALSRNIRFTFECAQQETKLWLDQDNFDKVLFNILSNAFKKTPNGGGIRIILGEAVKNDGALAVGIKEYVELSVLNTGSKLDDNQLDVIFDRFFQVNKNDSQNGVGVGLNLSKMLVELHHGDIRAYNTLDGVAFTMRLPLGKAHLSREETLVPEQSGELYAIYDDSTKAREDVTEAAVGRESEADKALKSKRNVVFVDDDDEMRAYLSMELQSQYNVESFSNARDAWNRITAMVPDAVITDLMMEGMDGAELCSKIKKNPGTNHIPVLILTSSEESIGRCIECGADRFFTKPTAVDIIKGAIDNAISTREAIRNKMLTVVDDAIMDLGVPDRRNVLINKVIQAINENIDNTEFNVGDLSAAVGLSRAHLNRKLKELMSITPNNLIKAIRLKQAAYLLVNHQVNISEVAYRVGFSSPSYFSNSFHDFFGMTPKEYVTKFQESEKPEGSPSRNEA